MERKSIRFTVWIIYGLLMLGVCAPAALAQATWKAVDTPQGGRIVYGKVDGANSQTDALISVLRSLHKNTGDKPLTGRAFRLRNTDSVAVFFTVIDHSNGNKPLAGLVIAAAAGPKQIEVAVVSGDASHFGKNVNPMLQMLADAWHPDGLKADSDPTWCGYAYRLYRRPSDAKTNTDAETAAVKRWNDELAFTPQNNADTNPPPALNSIRASDGTARARIPDGWKLRSDSGAGALVITGPNGELAGFNMIRQAIDPESPEQQLPPNDAANKTSDQLVYPANADIAKAFPDLFQQWRRLNGLGPTDLVIARAEKLPTPQGDRCVHVTGQVNPDGKGMQEMNTILCATEALRGKYMVLLFHTLLPLAVADKERATMSAILASFRLETPRYQRPDIETPRYEINRYVAQEKSGLYGVIEQEFNSSRVMIAVQGCHPSDPWGYNSYLFNEETLPKIDRSGNGATWNSAADALVKADPKHFEYVDTLNSVIGQDY